MIHTLTKQALEELRNDLFVGLKLTGLQQAAHFDTLPQKFASTITRLLEAEIERLEGMKKIDSGKCPECGGDGWVVESVPAVQSVQTPMQVQCHACFATGVIEMPNLDYNKAIDDHITYLKEQIKLIAEV